jgi:hypothetical protein
MAHTLGARGRNALMSSSCPVQNHQCSDFPPSTATYCCPVLTCSTPSSSASSRNERRSYRFGRSTPLASLMLKLPACRRKACAYPHRNDCLRQVTRCPTFRRAVVALAGSRVTTNAHLSLVCRQDASPLLASLQAHQTSADRRPKTRCNLHHQPPPKWSGPGVHAAHGSLRGCCRAARCADHPSLLIVTL